MILESIVQENYGVIASLEEIECIGHRVVHGGESFKESVVINDEVLKTISSCITIDVYKRQGIFCACNVFYCGLYNNN